MNKKKVKESTSSDPGPFGMEYRHMIADIDRKNRIKRENTEKGKICSKCRFFRKKNGNGRCTLYDKIIPSPDKYENQGCITENGFEKGIPIGREERKENAKVIQILPQNKKIAKIFNVSVVRDELVDTKEVIEIKDLEWIETRSFSKEGSYFRPVWGPVMDYAQEIGIDYVLYGEKYTAYSDYSSTVYTIATYFKKKIK